MGYGKREQLQKELALEPAPRASLPEAARQEAVAALATLLAAVLEETGRSGPDGSSDE
jgi:hypothetical protein